MVDGKDITLAKKEFELLYLLASRPGRVFLRNEILNQVWGNEVIVGDRTIDVHIRKIRQKLGLDCITTVKGVGYKFNPELTLIGADAFNQKSIPSDNYPLLPPSRSPCRSRRASIS